MNILIEKGIPLPESKNAKGRRRMYPFNDMEIGDSFSVPYDRGKALGVAMSEFHRRKTGQRFTTRRVGDVVRCWRLQ